MKKKRQASAEYKQCRQLSIIQRGVMIIIEKGVLQEKREKEKQMNTSLTCQG